MAPTTIAKPAVKSTAANSNKRPSGKLKAAIALPMLSMTKRDRLQARLEQVDGVSLTQLEQEVGWQPHTVRAAISGLRKAGLAVQRETVGASSVYLIVTSKVA